MIKVKRVLAGVMCLMALAGTMVATPSMEAYAAENITGVGINNRDEIDTYSSPNFFDAYVGNTLEATNISPADATVTYQWYRDTDGTYNEYVPSDTLTPIDGATSSIYTVRPEDIGYYLFVKVEGTGDYADSSAVNTYGIKVSGEFQVFITGKDKNKETLTAVMGSQLDTATYKWYRYKYDKNGIQYGTLIEGATSSTYTVKAEDIGYYLYVEATGTGNSAGKNASARTYTTIKPLDLAVSITGTSEGTDNPYICIGDTLTALTDPIEATVQYQWYRNTSGINGVRFGTPIEGETSKTYTVKEEDMDSSALFNYIYVEVTGSGDFIKSTATTYNGIEVKPKKTKTFTVCITGITENGETLTATTDPEEATATYQWYRYEQLDESNINGTPIAEATFKTYIVQPEDVGNYLFVEATGTGDYGGSLTATTPTVISSSGNGGDNTPDGSDSKLTDSSKDTQYETNDNFADEGYTGANKMVEVYVTQGAQFTVTIPKKIVIDGKNGSGDYRVIMKGDIAGNQEVKVAPRTASITLSTPGKSNITANITQSKTKFSVAADTMEGLKAGAVANGTIEADGLTSGKWTGVFDFDIQISEKAA